jgi:prophage maintenance system killer protein
MEGSSSMQRILGFGWGGTGTRKHSSRPERKFRRRPEVSGRATGQGHCKQLRELPSVIDVAAWVQHQIAYIHPFVEGNGRIARLMTNLILSRFGLPPSRVKYEGENKAAYIQALCQIDLYGDYDPLKQLISQSIFEGYKRERSIRQHNQQS